MGKHDIPIQRQAAHVVIATGALLKAEIDARLIATVGFPLADNEALANLRDAAGPLRMGEIAGRLTLSRSSVTNLVDRLEAAGYATRDADPSDRRATAVSITPAGLAALDESRPVIISAIDEYWSHHLSDDEASELHRVISGIFKANWC